MRRAPRAIWPLALSLAAASCGEVEAVDSAIAQPTPTIGLIEVELPSEAELAERARREISPKNFDAELERLRREIQGPEAPGPKRAGSRR